MSDLERRVNKVEFNPYAPPGDQDLEPSKLNQVEKESKKIIRKSLSASWKILAAYLPQEVYRKLVPNKEENKNYHALNLLFDMSVIAGVGISEFYDPNNFFGSMIVGAGAGMTVGLGINFFRERYETGHPVVVPAYNLLIRPFVKKN